MYSNAAKRQYNDIFGKALEKVAEQYSKTVPIAEAETKQEGQTNATPATH